MQNNSDDSEIITVLDIASKRPVRAVLAEKYLNLKQDAIKLRLALRRTVRSEDPTVAVAVLRALNEKTQERLSECEAALWRESNGQSLYFKQHPHAAPPGITRSPL